jgi:CubicO group peptidase (beta-lactamase class C family)
MEIGDEIANGGRDTLAAGRQPTELAALGIDPGPIDRLEVRGEPWGSATVDELFARHGGIGLVVLHRGRLAYERYASDDVVSRPNLCFSITKSFTGTVAALTGAAGRLDRSAVVGDLLPDLAGSGFADATVADIADMTASVAYDEDYDEATAPSERAGWRGFGDYMVAIGLDGSADPGAAAPDRPRTIRDLVRAIGPGTSPHGEAFAYATPVSDVLGWLLERTEGRDGRDTLDDVLWSRIGAERAARLTRDPAGTALMGAGLAMTTRDLARFGAVLAAGGVGPEGPVVDPAVIETIRDGGDPDVFQRGGHYAYLRGYSYRDQWWLPGGPSRPLSAWGIYGQVLWVDPDSEVVVAYHCGGPLPSDPQRDLEQDALCRSLVEASSGWP